MRFISYSFETIDMDFSNVIMCMPKVIDKTLTAEEVYYSHVESIASTHKFDLVLIDPSDISYISLRKDSVGNLLSELKLLECVLDDANSDISKEEPILHLLFEFFRLFYIEFGNFDYSKIKLFYDDFVNNFCKVVLKAYLFCDKVIMHSNRPEIVLSLKNLILLFFHYFTICLQRVRLLSLRSRATIQILDAHKNEMSSLLNETRSHNLLDTILDYCDHESLDKYCMPDDFIWFDTTAISQHIIQSSFSSLPSFSLNFKEKGECMCAIIKIQCTHAKCDSSANSNLNYCLPYVAARIFLHFALDAIEEYFSRLYIQYLNKIQYKHEFMPTDIKIIGYKITVDSIPPSNLVFCTDFNNFRDAYKNYRDHPLFSNYFVSVANLRVDNCLKSIETPSKETIKYFRDSFPTINGNVISSYGNYEESQIWTKLAVQWAYLSKDINTVSNASSYIIRLYMFIGRDYLNALFEIERLLQFCDDTLTGLPLLPICESSSVIIKRACQSNIVRFKSLHIQYKQHVAANLGDIFYPGELLAINISIFNNFTSFFHLLDGSIREVIYIAFEYVSKPIYIAHLEEKGGDCWSVVGCDISLIDSWRSVALDNIHMQFIGAIQSLMSQRFLFHTLRTQQYSVIRFCEDIKERNKYKITK